MEKKELGIFISGFVFLILIFGFLFMSEYRMSLVGFAVYDDSICGADTIMEESSTLSENITCLTGNGLKITCSNCTLNCQGYNFTGNLYEGTTGLNITGSNVTIKNCGLHFWDFPVEGSCIDGGGNTGDLIGICGEAELCVPERVNSTPTDWSNVSCVEDEMNQTRTITESDINDCEGSEDTNYTEYRLIGPTYSNTSWSEWGDGTCTGDEFNLSRSLTQYDIYGCVENITFYEYNLTGPEYDYTDWAEWDNETCVEDEMNQSATRTKYDTYECADNETEYDYQLTGPTYTNISISDWQDTLICVDSNTKNQSREINQSDIYECADNQTITEYQSVACSSGYSCSGGVCVADSTPPAGGGGSSCTPSTCSSLGKECGTIANGCGGTLNCGTCDSGYECSDGECISLNECDVSDYPKCLDENTSELCLFNSNLNYYYLKNDACSDGEECKEGECILKIREEINEENNPLPNIIEGITSLAKKPSSIIPHGNIPDIVVDTATYTTGVVIVTTGIHYLWLWLISLFLPVFLLRLRHYCLAFIDTKEILPFAEYEYDKKGNIKKSSINKKEIEKFILILQKKLKEKIVFTESVEYSYRFLFEKSGFIEVQLDSPTIINAHFSSSRRTRKFRKAFLETIRILSGQDKMIKMKKNLILTRESTTMIRAFRNMSRERKLRKISRNFKI